MNDLNWDVAKRYLDSMFRMHTEIGAAGESELKEDVNPLLARFDSGERTPKLHKEIMELK
ncbi:hypothetical protein LCGC14_1462990 [marine sediment metagenome]|uniref:Uncharacterized protein n=1 Tax=marine sediment metagenome TaxID=412755 RepID=A0A0F9K0J1_9ZZZZ